MPHPLRVCMLLVPIVALAWSSAGAVAPVPPVPRLKPIEVKLRGVSSRPAGFSYIGLIFEVSNPNIAVVPYSGYRPNSFEPPLEKGRISPLYVLEYRKGGKRTREEIGWCGMGIGAVSIPKQGTAWFEAPVRTEDWEAVRVGVQWSVPGGKSEEQPKIAWSEPITRAILEKAVTQP